MEKIINHVVLTVSAGLKARKTLSRKPLLHKDKSSIGTKFICNYRELVGMSIYLQVSTHLEISMTLHQCACFFNNPHLVNEHAVRRIAKYLASTSKYVDLPYGN